MKKGPKLFLNLMYSIMFFYTFYYLFNCELFFYIIQPKLLNMRFCLYKHDSSPIKINRNIKFFKKQGIT